MIGMIHFVLYAVLLYLKKLLKIFPIKHVLRQMDAKITSYYSTKKSYSNYSCNLEASFGYKTPSQERVDCKYPQAKIRKIRTQ